MQSDQLIEYNLRNIFLEKSYTRCGGETILWPFSKKSKLSISLGQYSKALYILFLLFAKLRTIESYWHQVVDFLLLLHMKLFWKTKWGLELISLSHFQYDFWRKIFISIYSITWPNFNVWLPLIREVLANICIAIVC